MPPRLRYFVYFLDFEMNSASRGPLCDSAASCFRDIAGFLLRNWPPLIFHPNFEGVSVEPDRRCGVSPSLYLKLINREIIFEVFQPLWSGYYLNVPDKRTDRRTTCRKIIALCIASRGKNEQIRMLKMLRHRKYHAVPISFMCRAISMKIRRGMSICAPWPTNPLSSVIEGMLNPYDWWRLISVSDAPRHAHWSFLYGTHRM